MRSEDKSIAIYKTADGDIHLDVKIEKETIWLNLNQIAKLFERDKSVILRHLRNIFKEEELDRNSTVAKIATVQSEGGRRIERNIEYYNLDVIISVGYRVNSKRATQFRIWATQVLKNYVLKGYAINQKRLLQQQGRFKELQRTIQFLQDKIETPALKGQSKEILSIINQYTHSLSLLFQYDERKVPLFKTQKPSFTLYYDLCLHLISKLKIALIEKGEASNLFGLENGKKLEGVLGAIYQTFGKRDLYETIEEKAAHLLY